MPHSIFFPGAAHLPIGTTIPGAPAMPPSVALGRGLPAQQPSSFPSPGIRRILGIPPGPINPRAAPFTPGGGPISIGPIPLPIPSPILPIIRRFLPGGTTVKPLGTPMPFHPANPLVPGLPPTTPTGPGGFDPCALLSGTARAICEAAGRFIGGGQQDPSTGITVPDPTPGSQTPGEASQGGAVGLQSPFAVQRTVLQCPVFGNGKVGILWMMPLTGQIVCLPRGVSGTAFGLIRKNKPAAKPFLTGGEVKCIKKAQRLSKSFAKKASMFGLVARKRGR